jgi:hypothetical protein
VSGVSERLPAWLPRVATLVALAALVAFSALLRWRWLTVSPFPLGVDGYFYPLQLRSLLEHGTLLYPSSPLTFYWMLPFAAATDPITGAKLGAALGTALVVLPAYGVAWQLTKQRAAGLVAASLVALSATSAYVTMEFVKQGIGLTVALVAVWLLLRALAAPTRGRISAVLVALLATVLTHKLAAGCVLAIAIPAGLEEARVRGVLRGRRLLYILVVGTLVALGGLVMGLVAPQRFLSPHDLALARSLFTSTAHWDAPALATPTLVLSFDHEAAIAGALGLVAALALWRRIGDTRTRGERAVAYAFCAFAIVLAIPWLAISDPQGLAFRLRVSAFVPLAIVGAIVASAAASYLPARWRHDALVALAVIVIARAPHERREGRVLPHPAMVAAVMAATTQIPKDTTVIVPERHILFMTAWYTHAPVSLRPEPIPYGHRMRLMPLSFIGMGSPLDEALDAARADGRVAEPPIGLHPRHRNGLVLVSEPTWDYLMASLPADVRRYWARWHTI